MIFLGVLMTKPPFPVIENELGKVSLSLVDDWLLSDINLSAFVILTTSLRDVLTPMFGHKKDFFSSSHPLTRPWLDGSNENPLGGSWIVRVE